MAAPNRNDHQAQHKKYTAQGNRGDYGLKTGLEPSNVAQAGRLVKGEVARLLRAPAVLAAQSPFLFLGGSCERIACRADVGRRR